MTIDPYTGPSASAETLTDDEVAEFLAEDALLRKALRECWPYRQQGEVAE